MNKPRTDLTQPLEWRRGMPFFNGKILHYDDVAARLAYAEQKIKDLQQANALLTQSLQVSKHVIS